jgi:hypothetical protein
MIRNLDDSNLLTTIKKSAHNLNIMKFENFRIQSMFQIFKSPLTHINGV